MSMCISPVHVAKCSVHISSLHLALQKQWTHGRFVVSEDCGEERRGRLRNHNDSPGNGNGTQLIRC